MEYFPNKSELIFFLFYFQSVDLWCDYLNFVQEHDPSVRECSASGISKARNLFERALTATGLHFAEGHRIWEAYREFEQAIFLTIAETGSGVRFAPFPVLLLCLFCSMHSPSECVCVCVRVRVIMCYVRLNLICGSRTAVFQ